MNSKITRRIIDLHTNGYDYDFVIDGEDILTCLQTGTQLSAQSASLTIVDQCYDRLSNCYVYIYTVETENGRKGLLFLNYIYIPGHSYNIADLTKQIEA